MIIKDYVDHNDLIKKIIQEQCTNWVSMFVSCIIYLSFSFCYAQAKDKLQ